MLSQRTPDYRLPNSRPTLATVGLFAFIPAWNDFGGPLIYLNDEPKRPSPSAYSSS